MIAWFRRSGVTVCLAVGACTGDSTPNVNAEVPRAASFRDAPTEAASKPANRDAERAPGASTRVRCVVAAVSDGDSFRCRDIQRVRLLLLDAPEMDQGAFGVRSRDALRARMPRGDTVWLEFDVQREDRYGRRGLWEDGAYTCEPLSH